MRLRTVIEFRYLVVVSTHNTETPRTQRAYSSRQRSSGTQRPWYTSDVLEDGLSLTPGSESTAGVAGVNGGDEREREGQIAPRIEMIVVLTAMG